MIFRGDFYTIHLWAKSLWVNKMHLNAEIEKLEDRGINWSHFLRFEQSQIFGIKSSSFLVLLGHIQHHHNPTTLWHWRELEVASSCPVTHTHHCFPCSIIWTDASELQEEHWRRSRTEVPAQIHHRETSDPRQIALSFIKWGQWIRTEAGKDFLKRSKRDLPGGPVV